MNRNLVHLVQGQIHDSGNEAADANCTHQVAHQVADGGVFAERDQRAVIVVNKFDRRFAGQPITQRFE